jgi:photosystem II stability/assembly factor-like uncharacterized protein
MNPIFQLWRRNSATVPALLLVLLVLAVLVAALPAFAAAPAFVDPLDLPAQASPLASRSLINGVAAAGTRLVAAGQRGHILYSDDGGATWQQARVPLSSDLVALSFADVRHGWAVGHDGVVLASADAGASWSRQYDGRQDPQVGDKPLLDVRFDGAGHGMAVGAFGLALCSDDSGGHWRHCEDLLDNPQGLHLNAIRAVGDSLYIVGEQGLVLRRAAGAADSARFEAVAMPYKGSFFGVAGTANSVVLYGLRGNALVSSDAGRSWQHAVTGTQTGLTAGTALADGTLLLATQAGQLLRSRDGGATFKPLPGVKPGPAAAILPAGGGSLLIGGARGLRLQPLDLH